MRCGLMVAVTLLLTLLGPTSGNTQNRVALVVGNSAYRDLTRLVNPANDARMIANTLSDLGFALVGGGAQLDLDKPSIDRAVQDFGKALIGAEVGLFYYAGHGIQVRGSNYLLPVDANPEREADVDFQMLDMNLVLRQMEGSKTRLNLVILDACRNNPFGGRGLAVGRGRDRDTVRLRDAAGGLAQMQAPAGTLISFATQPGSVAQDGVGGNSPYTKALAGAIRRPGLGIFDVFNQVGVQVKRATGGEQQPWVSSSPIEGAFYFVPPTGGVTAADEIAWSALKDTTDAAALRQFVVDYPGSARLSEATARIAALNSRPAEARRGTGEARDTVVVTAPPLRPAVPPSSNPVMPAVAAVPLARPQHPCGGTAVAVSLPSRQERPLSEAEECALKPKDVFKECDKCPEMVVVPAGSFTMGSPASAVGRAPNEGPEHGVTFAQPFAVGRFHITIDQFAAFATETRFNTADACSTVEGGKREERTGRSWRNPGFAQTGTHPAVCLSWNDAQAYVEWLGRKTNKNYRLLTEAEWEYVARARTEPGTYSRYSFGDDEKDLCRYGNGADQTTKKSMASGRKDWTAAPCTDGYAYTSPVGRFVANDFGVYDMQGNALQWTQDCYHDNYIGSPLDGSAWISGDCGRRVPRGGGWNDNPWSLRAAYRGVNGLGYHGFGIGFRVARTL